MAQLDPYLSAALANGAEALELADDEPATLRLKGVPRAITRQPLTGQQLLALVREVAPRNALRAIAAGGPAAFSYALGERVFVARMAQYNQRWRVVFTPASPG